MAANGAAGRYELKELLGEGGMGVVYRAFDNRTNSFVAIKTLRDASDPAMLEMFKREWEKLAELSHPNIVDIRDVDEIMDGGVRKPCFIMPLLPGVTLATLIKKASPRLTVEFVVDLITQVCRGLQAAHENELVHRDLKPSNIFVMNDDTAKIIDFGLVHSADLKSVTGLKGTWQYMAPEQAEGKPPSRRTDIFSLGVVAYEALTHEQPFRRQKIEDTVEAVRHFMPTAISQKNPRVTQLLSKAVHVAMAKQPIHRYASAREFSDTLQKAYHNQHIDRFDEAKIRPRIERAKKAFSSGDAVYASEILTELEAEGNLDPDITLLREQMDASAKQKRIAQLFEVAQTRLEQEELPLALDKLAEILNLDPENQEALSMQKRIGEQRSKKQISDWMRLAREHLDSNNFQEAKQALKEVFALRYDDPEAARLKADVDAREREAAKARGEKEQLYISALKAQQNGEISSALSRLEKILDLSRGVPGSAVPERDKVYQAFYNDVRSERDRIDNLYGEGSRHVSEKSFEKALRVCDEVLAKYPRNAQFQALRLKAEQAQRQELSAYIAEVGRAVDTEPNLDKRVGLLEEACSKYPKEGQFERQLGLAREHRSLVTSILAKAKIYEEQGQFGEAIGQWKILTNIHPQYPGLDFEISQLERRRGQQAEEEKKARLVERIDRALENSAFPEAERLAKDALVEFPQDPELMALLRLAKQGSEKTQDADRLFAEAKHNRAAGELDRAIELLRQALDLDRRNIVIQNTLVNLLVERAHAILGSDWAAAEPLAQEAGELDPDHQSVRRINALVAQTKRKDYIDRCVSRARELQATDVAQALEAIDHGLLEYPGDVRLLQTRNSLLNQHPELQRPAARENPAKVRAATAQEQGREPADRTMVYSDLGDDRTRTATPVPRPQNPPQREKAGKPPKQAAAVPPKQAPVRQPNPWLKNLQEQARTKTARGIAGIKALNFQSWHVRGVLAGLVLLVLAIGFAVLRHPTPTGSIADHTKKEVSKDIEVSIVTTPSDAQVTVNGLVAGPKLSLKPNSTNKVSVAREGYQTLTQEMPVNKPWVFTLEPEQLHISVHTAETTGSVSLDGGKIANLESGETPDFTMAPDGKEHTLSGRSAVGELFTVKFTAAAGEIATLAPVSTKNLIVISALGKQATIYSGSPGKTLAIEGKDPENIPAQGLAVNLEDASGGLTIAGGGHTDTLAVTRSNAPALNISLNANPNLGSIDISTPAANADLYIAGQKQVRKKGTWSLTRPPGTYPAKLSAAGMKDKEFQIQVVRGQAFRQRITLEPLPQMATLIVKGGNEGTSVFVDGVNVGELDGQGNFSDPGVTPGTRKIELKKDGYETVTSTQTFAAGKAMNFLGETKAKPQVGYVQASATPAGVTIRYRKAGDSEWHPLEQGPAVQFPPGSYDFEASGENLTPDAAKKVVDAGKVTLLSFALKPVIVKQQLTWFESAAQVQKKEEDWYTGATKDTWVAVRPGLAKNSIIFLKPDHYPPQASKPKHLMWQVVLDGQDKISYSLDSRKGLTVDKILSGEKADPISLKVDMGDGSAKYQVKIVLEPHAVKITDKDGKTLNVVSDERHDWSNARILVKGDAYFVVWRGQ